MDSETLYYDTFEDVQEYIKNHERQYGVQFIRRTSSVGFANDASCSKFSCTIISLIRSFLTRIPSTEFSTTVESGVAMFSSFIIHHHIGQCWSFAGRSRVFRHKDCPENQPVLYVAKAGKVCD